MRFDRPLRRRLFAPLRLLAASAALCALALSLWLPRHASQTRVVARVPARPAAESVNDDAALLQRVNTYLSRTVPSPLEPLAAPLESARQTIKEDR